MHFALAACLILILHVVPGLDPSERAAGQCQYSTVVIEGPPCPFGGLAVLIPQGLNNHGHVVGRWDHCGDDGAEAFFWSAETGLVTLPRPKGVFRASASDINDHGVIVGEHWFSYSEIRAFAYDMNEGEFEYLQPLNGAGTSWASAINNDGLMVGRRSIGKLDDTPYNAVIWNTNTGEITDLGVMNGPNSSARDISESGDVCGWTGTQLNQIAFLKKRGHSPIIIDTAFGASKSDDQFFLVDPLDGYTGCGAVDVNSLGQILVDNIPGHVPGLWQHGEHVRVFDLFATESGGAISAPIALSDAGHILGRHINTKAILLTPVNQPVGDINADCVTEAHDLLLLLNVWGPCENSHFCIGDINDDEVVNVLDLLMLLENWD